MGGHIRKHELKGGRIYEPIVNRGVDASGKRIRISKRLPLGTTRKEAERVLREMMSAVEEQIYVPDTDITVEKYLFQWMETFIIPIKSSSTVVSYRNIIDFYLNPRFGRVKLKDLSGMAIQKFYNELSQISLRKVTGLSNKTIRNIHMVFNAALKKAVACDILKKNPARNVELKKPVQYKAEIYDMDELQLLLTAIKGTDMELPVKICLYMGLRRGELLALTWDQVDFMNHTINIEKNFVQVGVKAMTKDPKTESSKRKIEAPIVLMDLLKRSHTDYKIRKLKHGRSFHDTNLVICQSDGQGFLPDSFSQKFRRFLSKYGLRHIRVHDLRHENATLMLKAGVNPKVMQKRLGHSNYSTTMDIYSHVLAETERDAVVQLESSLRHLSM
jgi:integrase